MSRRTRMLLVACVVLAAAAWVGGFGLAPDLVPAPRSGAPAARPETTAAAPPGAEDAPSVPGDAEVAHVVRVVDGDTVRLRARGDGVLPAGVHRVRLLGVDAPELHVDGGPECGADAATAFLADLLGGTSVRVQADREDRDRYDRPLRYLWTSDGTFVNGALVAAGHARAVLFAPNDRYWHALTATEADARAADVGMWGACAR